MISIIQYDQIFNKYYYIIFDKYYAILKIHIYYLGYNCHSSLHSPTFTCINSFITILKYTHL